MTPQDLDQIMPIEQSVQPHAWPREAFLQAIALNQYCIVYEENNIIEAYGCSDYGHGRTIAATTVEGADAIYRGWLTAAREAGVDKVYAEIETTNRAARIRLKRFGFQMIGTKPNFYGVGQDAQVWERQTVQNDTEENAAEGSTTPLDETA